MNNTSDTSDGGQYEDACSRWIQLNNDSSTNLTQTQELEFLQACVGPQRWARPRTFLKYIFIKIFVTLKTF